MEEREECCSCITSLGMIAAIRVATAFTFTATGECRADAEAPKTSSRSAAPPNRSICCRKPDRRAPESTRRTVPRRSPVSCWALICAPRCDGRRVTGSRLCAEGRSTQPGSPPLCSKNRLGTFHPSEPVMDLSFLPPVATSVRTKPGSQPHGCGRAATRPRLLLGWTGEQKGDARLGNHDPDGAGYILCCPYSNAFRRGSLEEPDVGDVLTTHLKPGLCRAGSIAGVRMLSAV